MQFRLDSAPFYIYSQNFVDLRFIAAAARGQPRTDKVRLLANQTNVEHGAIVEVAVADGK